jgi:outer membrane protein assembly factor BamA
VNRISFAIIVCVALCAAAAESQAPLRIGRITIEATPVFKASDAGGFYRGVNLLHVQTRPELLRRFLLFKEGDPYDPAKLAETERNLRLFDFLTSVSVTAGPPHDGVVDVVVATQDAWTTDVTGDFSNEGGKSAYNVDVTQKDLFGSGSALDLRTESGIERRAHSIEFLHPGIFGPYWNLDAFYSHNSDGNEERLQLNRPLFSYTTRWATSFFFDHDLRNERIFKLGEVSSRFRHEHREISLSRSLVLAANQNGSSSIVGGVDLVDDSFANLPARPLDVIPAARHFDFLDAGYESTGFHFVKLDYIDRDRIEQDFNLGLVTSIHLSVSPGTTWRARLSESIGHDFREGSFLIGQVGASARAPGNRNGIVFGDLRFVSRWYTRYPQTFVARARADVGSQLDRDVQFYADGQNGLRAYPDFAFEGSKRFIVNAEHRVFLGRELLQIFGPGVAVFVDSGQAADRNLRLRGMKTDAGVGLRIGIAPLSALIRIDVSYAFNSSPLNRPGPVISISTVQAF